MGSGIVDQTRPLQRDFVRVPEAFIFLILSIIVDIALLFAQDNRTWELLAYCHLFCLSTVIGALWVIVFPASVRDWQPRHVICKSVFILALGLGIGLIDWFVATFMNVNYWMVGARESGIVSGWSCVIGGIVGISGILGLILRNRLARGLRSYPTVLLRQCALLVIAAAIFLAVKTSMAVAQLMRSAANSV